MITNSCANKTLNTLNYQEKKYEGINYEQEINGEKIKKIYILKYQKESDKKDAENKRNLGEKITKNKR